ncbi:MAG: diaminopimelate decarboxylase [Acidimicrobiia bacterium]|nr:diaminopimelate decarboxylase [Acidimicrobiia bacterium]
MAGPLPPHLLPDGATSDAGGRLSVAGCDLVDLAGEFGTPLIVYDEDHLRARCGEARAVFGEGGVAYAAKAFLCRAMVQLVQQEGLHLDVSTDGELHVALAAGFPPQRLVLHGNNKSPEELASAVDAGVGRIVVDSFDELDRLDALAAERGCRPAVLLRVTPGVEAHTHVYLTTGRDDSKFGFTVSTGAAAEAVERARAAGSVELLGIHAHIGSQVFRLDSFAQAVSTVAAFANPLGLAELSVGGGLGVAYVTGEEAPSITAWGEAVLEAAAAAGVTARLSVEPGRAITAAAAIALYEVGTVKDLPGIRTYVAVDGGMSDNPRPVLYGSGYEVFLPRAATAERPRAVRVVGKHCESGDVLVSDGWVPPDLAVGDVLGVPVAGAYGYAMASNYNKVPRPAVLFLRNGEVRPVIRRETYDDLLRLDL